MKRFKLFLIICIGIVLSVNSSSAGLNETLSQRVSPKFYGISLDNALRLFAKQYSLNLVIGGDPQGKITVELYNVTLEDALNTILKAHGYHYVIDNEVILIKPLKVSVNGELQTKVFKLNFIDGYHLKTAIEPLISEKGKIEALLSEPEQEEKYQRSNFIVVTDYWENLQRIDEVTKIMDVKGRQMQIEVRLVETLMTDEKQVGLNLPKSIGVTLTGAETTAPITKSQTSTSGQSVLSAWYQLPSGSDDLTLGVITFDELKATLDFLANDNNSRLISNPKVTALNNKKALIKIGTTVPIPELSRGVGGDYISYREKDVDMSVEVIPLISDDGNITLNVHPILEEIIGYTGPTETPQPITSKREVKTTVMVKDGETVVIGGLVKESESKIVNKVWLLGDIPLLGYFFKHTSTIKEKKDLLIFITTKLM